MIQARAEGSMIESSITEFDVELMERIQSIKSSNINLLEDPKDNFNKQIKYLKPDSKVVKQPTSITKMQTMI